MPDVAELGRKVKRKYPGAYDDLSDADLGRKVKKKYPGAYDDFTDAPAATGPGFIQRTGENIKTGLAQAGQSYRESEAAILEALAGAARRDFRPLREGAEMAGRSLIRTIGTYAPVSAGLGPAAAAQEAPIARIRTEQAQRRAADTADPKFKEYLGRVAQQGGDIEARAARDPSLTGRITRGVVRTGAEMLPAVGVGLATGGSLPAIAATTALQSAGQPETLPLNVALSVTPIPVGQAFRAGINSVRRAFGKGAAQVIEAEALPAATARVRQSIGEPPPVAPSATSLQSAFAKLGTDNVDEIAEMIANANRRLNETRTVPGGTKRPITTEERLSSWEDYNRLKQITADEHRALSQVLPPRNYEPVGIFEKGKPSRNITDIPAGQPNAQLDANLRELEQFFGGQRGAQAAPTVPAGRVVTVGDKTYRLTPEQEARWTAEIDAATVRNKGDAMRLAAIKRGIVNAPTAKEEAAAIAREATNYKGKPVVVDIGGRQVPATVEGMAFGRVKVKLADGQRVTVEPARISAETGPPASAADMSISAATPRAAGASVTGPRTQTAALEVSPTTAPAPPAGGLPPEFTGGGFSRPPRQQQLFDAAARSPWQDTVLAYFRGNLLTNPISRANDLGQTIINQFADAPVRPIAAAVDVVVSKLTGKRAITGPSLSGTRRAFGSIRQGLRDVGEVMRTGRQVIDSGADDVLYGSEIRSGLGRGLDVPVNGVFRLLGALDAPFRRFGFARNLFDRAKVAAINEAKRGKIPWDQKSARIRELMDRDDIIKAAVRDGEKAVLSESNRFSAWVASQTRNSPNARLAVGIIQPFLRIPANAALKAADFAGVGGVKALYKVARGGVRKAKGESFFRDLEDQRVFAQNVAAGSFGVAGFLLGMELEERGKLEGFYYTSGKDYPNGRVPISIEIGGKRYDINRLGGFIFAPLFVGATYNRLRKKDAGKANALLRSFSGLAQQAPGLGYYGAPAKAGRILTAEKPGAEVAKQAGDIASGFIPASGLVRATAKAFDLLPGKGPRSAIIDATLEQNRPLFSELQRLNKRVAELRRKEGEKDDAFNARVQQFSQNYTRFGLQLIASPRFQAAPDVVKDIALDRLDQRAKHITHREFAFPEIELDANIIMDAAEQSKKNPANK